MAKRTTRRVVMVICIFWYIGVGVEEGKVMMMREDVGKKTRCEVCSVYIPEREWVYFCTCQ